MHTTSQSPSVLIAEDHTELRRVLARTLRAAGYSVAEAVDGIDLMHALGIDPEARQWVPAYDVVVTDVRMPGLSGLCVVEALGALTRAERVVLISAFADAQVRDQAARLGIPVLSKPFPLHALVACVRGLVDVPESPGPAPPVVSSSHARWSPGWRGRLHPLRG